MARPLLAWHITEQSCCWVHEGWRLSLTTVAWSREAPNSRSAVFCVELQISPKHSSPWVLRQDLQTCSASGGQINNQMSQEKSQISGYLGHNTANPELEAVHSCQCPAEPKLEHITQVILTCTNISWISSLRRFCLVRAGLRISLWPRLLVFISPTAHIVCEYVATRCHELKYEFTACHHLPTLLAGCVNQGRITCPKFSRLPSKVEKW